MIVGLYPKWKKGIFYLSLNSCENYKLKLGSYESERGALNIFLKISHYQM